MICWENYEEHMMLHADGELQPAEEQELIAFIKAHPELESELKAYTLTHLLPDETIVYANKNALLKTEPAKRTIAFSPWRRYAIAAGIAALLCFSFFKDMETSRNNATIATANTTTIPLNNSRPSIPVAVEKTEEENKAVAAAHSAKALPVVHNEQHIPIAHTVRTNNKKQEETAFINRSIAVVKPVMQINELDITSTKALPYSNEEASIPLVVVPAYEIHENKPAKRSLIDRLPIDKSNRKQWKTISRLATGTYNGVNKAAQELNGPEITFNIKETKLHISF